MIKDFGDWLSPMLVKELRQGMRSRIFMAAFYLTQLLMILTVVFNLVATSEGSTETDTAGFLNGLFWIMISIPLLFLTPIRGFGSIHEEIRGGTIELVFLTRLTAWRIAAGKWTALMVQTLLLVSAILPYVLLRYFLGGVNVIEDLQTLLLLLLTSASLTALTVAISPYESKLLRVLFIIGMLGSALFLLGSVLTWMAYGRLTGGATLANWQVYLGAAIYIPAFVILSLEIAASRIAPPAENHALRKRLIGLYFLLVATGLSAFTDTDASVYVFSLLFIGAVVVDALGEPVYVIPSIYRPFLQRGSWGRMLGGIFTPGWVAASRYVAVLGILGGLSLWATGQLNDETKALGYISYFGFLIFPAALIRLLVPTTKFFLGFYLALQFLLAAITLLVAMMAGISNEPLTTWLCIIPNAVFLLNLTGQVTPDQLPAFLIVTLAVTAASLGILLARTITPQRDIRAALPQNL